MDPKQRKILFITSFTLPETAGSGIHAFRFARFINRQGDQATILTFNRNLRLKSYEVIDNVSIIRIPYFNRGVLMKLLSLPLVIIWYMIHILKHQIIFIYGGKTFGYEIAIIISKLFCRKIIFQSLLYKVDDPDSLIRNKKISGYFYHRLFAFLDCYYSINHDFSLQYFKFFTNQKSLLELPQGVDTSIFHPSDNKKTFREKLHLPASSYLILSIGSLIHRKGFEEMFTAIKNLRFNYHLIILGEYSVDKNHFLIKHEKEMNDLYQKGKSILGNNISFIGFREDIEHYIKSSDVFIMNSIQEGLPNVLLEAMACKIPVITKNIIGVNVFLTKHKENSFVFETPSELYSQINYLYSHPDVRERIALNGYKNIVDNYSFQQVYSTLIKKLYA